jgi:hypothetical protein
MIDQYLFNMKVILSESQYHLLRRHGSLEEILNRIINNPNIVYNIFDGFRVKWDEFHHTIGYVVSNEFMKTEPNIDDPVKHRNQLQRYVMNNFYDVIADKYKEYKNTI